MNEGLKQRIVGTVVLIAVAGIFLPMFLEFESPRPVDPATQIPPHPSIQPVELPEPTRPTNVPQPKPVESAFLPDYTEQDDGGQADELQQTAPPTDSGATAGQNRTLVPKEPEKSAPPRLTEEGIPEAWVLQVGSFREHTRAEVLMGNLRKDGFKAYIRSQQVGGAPVHRVFVGPDILKANALADKKTVDSKYGVNSLVRKFEP